MFITPKNNHGIAYGIIDETQDNINITSNLDGDFNILVIGTRKDEYATKGFPGVEEYNGQVKS